MNKRRTFLFFIVVVITLSIISILNKPTENDYEKWLKKEYGIDCKEDCSIIEMTSINGDITERIKYADVKGTNSSGLFTLRINRQYQSLNDPENMMNIDVIGFNGRFYTLTSRNEPK
ncbi:hypothetical protein [Rossellomorea sp. NPDC077527]|uniref:hypothetical protein n=1 Tax=Rossellomorea sp. NPDC077527 TaxID=3364510 RepID=UPI0037CAC521